MMNKSFTLTVIIILLSVFSIQLKGQTNDEQTVKSKFTEYITPRLDGRELNLKIFSGDINNDGLTDCVITYCVQATDQDREVGGGNALANLMCMQDGIAVYIKKGTDYTLKADKGMDNFKVYSENEISFEVKEILNGKILCESTSYGPDDPRCCPSVIKKVYVVYDNGKLLKK